MKPEDEQLVNRVREQLVEFFTSMQLGPEMKYSDDEWPEHRLITGRLAWPATPLGKRGRKSGRNKLRDALLPRAVEIAHSAGMKLGRNASQTVRPSAFSLIAEVLSGYGENIGEDAVRKAWRVQEKVQRLSLDRGGFKPFGSVVEDLMRDIDSKRSKRRKK